MDGVENDGKLAGIHDDTRGNMAEEDKVVIARSLVKVGQTKGDVSRLGRASREREGGRGASWWGRRNVTLGCILFTNYECGRLPSKKKIQPLLNSTPAQFL